MRQCEMAPDRRQRRLAAVAQLPRQPVTIRQAALGRTRSMIAVMRIERTVGIQAQAGLDVELTRLVMKLATAATILG